MSNRQSPLEDLWIQGSGLAWESAAVILYQRGAFLYSRCGTVSRCCGTCTVVDVAQAIPVGRYQTLSLMLLPPRLERRQGYRAVRHRQTLVGLLAFHGSARKRKKKSVMGLGTHSHRNKTPKSASPPSRGDPPRQLLASTWTLVC